MVCRLFFSFYKCFWRDIVVSWAQICLQGASYQQRAMPRSLWCGTEVEWFSQGRGEVDRDVGLQEAKRASRWGLWGGFWPEVVFRPCWKWRMGFWSPVRARFEQRQGGWWKGGWCPLCCLWVPQALCRHSFLMLTLPLHFVCRASSTWAPVRTNSALTFCPGG